jgi:hypothetical protein
MELRWWQDAPPFFFDPVTKCGRGACSACYCDGPAVFYTIRSGRLWCLCLEHAHALQPSAPIGGPEPVGDGLPGDAQFSGSRRG